MLRSTIHESLRMPFKRLCEHDLTLCDDLVCDAVMHHCGCEHGKS